MRGASPPCFQFVAVLSVSLWHVSHKVRCTAVALSVLQRQGRDALSVTLPLASLRLDLQTDRLREARDSAAEKYRRFHQRGTSTKLIFSPFRVRKK